jgi:hypothetical protein
VTKEGFLFVCFLVFVFQVCVCVCVCVCVTFWFHYYSSGCPSLLKYYNGLMGFLCVQWGSRCSLCTANITSTLTLSEYEDTAPATLLLRLLSHPMHRGDGSAKEVTWEWRLSAKDVGGQIPTVSQDSHQDWASVVLHSNVLISIPFFYFLLFPVLLCHSSPSLLESIKSLFRGLLLGESKSAYRKRTFRMGYWLERWESLHSWQ